MSRFNYGQVSSLADAMPNDNFELFLGVIPGGAEAGAGRELSLRCQQIVMPGMNNDVMNVTLHSFDMVFSGKNTFNKTITAAFVEGSINMPVHKALCQWQQAVRGTRSGTSLGYKNAYSIDLVRLVAYDSTGRPAATARLSSFMIQAVDDIQFDGTAANPVLVNSTFSYHKSIRSDVLER